MVKALGFGVLVTVAVTLVVFYYYPSSSCCIYTHVTRNLGQVITMKNRMVKHNTEHEIEQSKVPCAEVFACVLFSGLCHS